MRLFAILFALATLATAQSVDFSGLFSSSEMQLQVNRTRLGVLSGRIEIKGQQLLFKATAEGASLKGAFETEGQAFPFVATLEGNQLRLVSEGHEYLLSRVTPAAPGNLHRHASGFTVRPPAGWSATDKDQGVLMQPPNAAPEEVYLALAQEGYSPQDEQSAMRELSKAFLTKAASVQRSGDREAIPGGAAYHWELTEPQNQRLIALSIYVIPAGTRAHLVVAAGPAERVRLHQNTLVPVVQSIRYQPPPPGVLSNVTRPWDQKLRGKVIRQFWASQGMSSDKKHYLNADGTYAFWSNSLVSVDVPGASASSIGKDNQRGRWSIIERGGVPHLQVIYNSGETSLFAITQDSTNWYLNGQKAFAVEQ